MRTVIECVPNFSEGVSLPAVQEIGPAVRAGVLALFEAALPRIDLTRHRGGHPRMGAVDVVPLIPIRGATIADCVALSREIGEEIGLRFSVPVYLYEYSATAENRRNLADVRKGEFEGLGAKMQKPEWKPDFGPDLPHATAGAVAVGARAPLIAYNINLA